MSQHKQSLKRTLRSALKHKRAADAILDSIANLTVEIIVAKDKVAADTNTTWDTDYEALASVSEVDFDKKGQEQHKATLRQVLRSSLAHKKLADEIADSIEEAQVSFNAVLVKMDSGAGTLDPDDAVWGAFKILDKIENDKAGTDAQHKSPLRSSLEKAVSHKVLASFIVDGIFVIQSGINNLIDDISAKN